MRRLLNVLLRAFLTLCLCVMLVACTKVTQENFDKIQPGMSMQQVVAVLGEPTSSESVDFGGISGASVTWKYKNAEIDIQFLNNRVQIKSFSKSNEEQKPVRK